MIPAMTLTTSLTQIELTVLFLELAFPNPIGILSFLILIYEKPYYSNFLPYSVNTKYIILIFNE